MLRRLPTRVPSCPESAVVPADRPPFGLDVQTIVPRWRRSRLVQQGYVAGEVAPPRWRRPQFALARRWFMFQPTTFMLPPPSKAKAPQPAARNSS
jgi:hypothetical protein